MKTSRPWELKEGIYSLCNKKQYFTGGTNSQYDKLFYMADKPEFTIRDLAVLIWACSHDADLEEIQKEIETIHKDIEDFEASIREQELLDREYEYIDYTKEEPAP